VNVMFLIMHEIRAGHGQPIGQICLLQKEKDSVVKQANCQKDLSLSVRDRAHSRIACRSGVLLQLRV
jgi:hypothetical protein